LKGGRCFTPLSALLLLFLLLVFLLAVIGLLLVRRRPFVVLRGRIAFILVAHGVSPDFQALVATPAGMALHLLRIGAAKLSRPLKEDACRPGTRAACGIV
jgi:hypothetical protein